MTRISKKVTFFIIGAVTCCLLVFGMCGCNGFGAGFNPTDIEKTKTTAYFGELNTIVKEFNSVLSDFQNDVKDKNVTGMQDKVSASQNIIDELNKIEVPEKCSEIQQTYSDALLQLQQSLSDYVQIYSDFVNGQIDNAVLNERVGNVQKSYNQGLDLLNKADKLATELN